MSILFTADLHFTDNPRDLHRWDLLPWLAKQADKYKVNAVIIGGDLTDAKDKHSAALTNRMVRGLQELADTVPVYILRGNHDYIDEAEPFFGFVDEDNGDTRVLRFLTKPEMVRIGKARVLLLPNTRDYESAWAELIEDAWGNADIIFTHQTYDGCLTENGTKLEGIPPSVFAKFEGRVWSGDIHKPQKVGKNIEYVGAPYRCRFGDDYTPRVLLIQDDGKTKDLHFPTKNKVLVNLDPHERLTKWTGEDLYEGDQVKVRVTLPRVQYAEWPTIKQQVVDDAAKLGLELTGPELVALAAPDKPAAPKEGGLQAQTGPAEAVVAYAKAKAAPAALKTAGLAYLQKAQEG